MAFISMMDDSSPEKIRKSIFIFASIIVFSLLYKLEITVPESLFSSASTTDKEIINIKIKYEVIVSLLAVFQCYLIARVFLSWKISKAKFAKLWIVDEYDDREDKSDLLNELDAFQKYCKEHPYPQNFELDKLKNLCDQVPESITSALEQIEFVKSLLIDSRDSWDKIRSELNMTNKLLRFLIADRELLTDTEQQKLLKRFPHIERVKPDARDPKFTGDLYQIATRFIERIHALERGELKTKLGNLEKILESVSPNIEITSQQLKKINSLNEKYNEFASVYPVSVFRQAIDVKPSDLNRAKKIREFELDIFDFWFPLIIGLVSIFFSFAPYVEALDSILISVREAAGILKT